MDTCRNNFKVTRVNKTYLEHPKNSTYYIAIEINLHTEEKIYIEHSFDWNKEIKTPMKINHIAKE